MTRANVAVSATAPMTPLFVKIIDPRANLAAVREFRATVDRYGELIREMSRRDILDRYSGQMLGALWAIGTPLLLMGVYILSTTLIFRTRLDAQTGTSHYAVYLLAGLAPWLALQEVASRAPSAVVGNANLVKQIVFPSEILPLKMALGAIPTLLVGLAVDLVLAVCVGMYPTWSWLLLLILVPCQIAISAGIAYLLGAIGVFVRDIKDVVAILLSIGLFLHPILYAPHAAPRWLERVFDLSPVSHLIWCYRDAIFYGRITQPWSWAITVATALISLTFGYRIFRMLRPSFGNVL